MNAELEQMRANAQAGRAGLHLGIPESRYHDDCLAPEPSLSSSIAKVLLYDCPRLAWWKHPRLNPDWREEEFSSEKQKMLDLGEVRHKLVLETGGKIDVTPPSVWVIEADNWRKKVTQDARDEAHANGLTPILLKDFGACQRMANALHSQLAQTELAGVFLHGDAEVTGLWQDDGGVWCRIRPDWLTTDRTLIVDYKTTDTSPEPEAFLRQIAYMGYDLQDGMYVRGVKRITGIEPKFVFLVQSASEPYLISLVGLNPASMAFADYQAQRAIDLWAKCLRENTWPAYPKRICWGEIAAWRQAQFVEKELREEIE